MDYEFKCVVAFCLIVKIAALSSEFPIGNETKKAEQSFGEAGVLLLPSLAGPEPPTIPPDGKNHGMHVDPGREKGNFGETKLLNNGLKELKRINGGTDFEKCDTILELLENPVKWWKIKRTLRWLNQNLSSNENILRRCLQQKPSEKKSSSINENSGFPTSKRNLARRKFKNLQFKKKKNPKNPIANRGRDLINSPKSNIYLKRNKKLRKERKHKHKSRGNRLKNKGNKRGRFEHKEKENFRYIRRHFQRKNSKKISKILNDSPVGANANILKPNSVLFDVKKMPSTEDNEKVKNHNSNECQSLNGHLKNSIVKINNDCLNKLDAVNVAYKWGSSKRDFLEMKKSASKQEKMETPSQKDKTWPHFVYHRVSSNFLYPDSKDHKHRPSAYLAISVASSSNVESLDKKVK